MSKTASTPSIGSAGNTCMSQRYAMTEEELYDLCSDMVHPNFAENIGRLFNNPADFFISLYLFPFDVKELAGPRIGGQLVADAPIKIGRVQMDANGADLIREVVPMLDIGSIAVPRYFNSFLDYAPYTKIELYLPYIGFITLDNDLVVGETVSIKYAVDLYTGKCTAFISTGSGTSEKIIMTQEGQIGRCIQLAGADGGGIERALWRAPLDAIMGVEKMASTGNPGALISSVDKVLTTKYQVFKNGSMDSGNSFYAPQNAYIIYTRPTITRPTSYESNVGRPSGKTKQLQQLSGFTVVSEVHVEGSDFGTATTDELNEIERLLKVGVIL